MNENIFMKKTIIFVLLFVVLLLYLNQLYILKVDSNKYIHRKQIEWDSYKKTLYNNTLDYAILGDSHPRTALNPAFINNSFNFAIPAEDYTETYYKLKNLLEVDKVRIKNLVLQIDVHTFSDKLRNDDNLFKEIRYYGNFIPLEDISNLKKKGKVPLFLEINFPVLGNGPELITQLADAQSLTLSNRGWVNSTDNFSISKNKTNDALNTYKRHFNKDPNLIENRSREHFIQILKLVEKNNINVIFVKYPVSNEYSLQLKNHYIPVDEYYSKLFNELKNVTINYTVFDYSTFFNISDYFSDPDHLNYIGSSVLSKKFSTDIQNVNFTYL